MIATPERSPERDAIIDALAARVPAQGWTRLALRGALADTGGDPADADLLFPGGAAELVESFIDLADRRMEAGAAGLDLAALRTPGRVRALIALRLQQQRPHRDAIRRGLAVLARPRHADVAARCLARTVDTIWHVSGDRAADFSWYTKRATLAATYAATLLYWLRDTSDDDADTLAFLDRRLAGIGRIGALRKRIAARCARPGGRAQAA
jgi:ubiquinone biosynthesis protein COQ9